MKKSLRDFLMRKLSKKTVVAIVAAFMLLTSFSVLISAQLGNTPTPLPGNSSGTVSHSSTPTYNGPMVAVATPPQAISTMNNISYNGNVNVLVTFKLSNQSELNNFLSDLSNKASPLYHHYITRQQFGKRFGPSNSTYNAAVNYFETFSGLRVSTYADHVSLLVKGPAAQIGHAFNTTLTSNGNGTYSAVSNPFLPTSLAPSVSIVTGLSNKHLNLSLNYGSMPVSAPPKSVSAQSRGYPAPSSTSPYYYGSNMQVAYNEQSLLNVTYPTKQVVATILWSGYNNLTMQNVAPFYPSDIYAYYNASLPSYEPHSKVYGVPVNGAPMPGYSANNDTTGAVGENTLDLEMVGSTAPGSSIYNVYGPNATYESLDAALAYILNPNSTYSALNNVSVITNSWGGSDYNNTVWYSYLQEAQARGITVLASSGDSGDNKQSSKYMPASDYTEFPSSMAYNNFGVTAVGGTTVNLSRDSTLLSQIAWYISANYTSDGGPAGSTGGISVNFTEPIWQLNSLANKVIGGTGRATPDISAIANNTIVYQTVNGTSYWGKPYFYIYWGTSIASPIEAGIVAEMDAILHHYNQSNLGFLNPVIYRLADMQFANLTSINTGSFDLTGGYNSSLPVTPFNNVDTGRNHVYTAGYPYNLVTGWGSIDAYNFTSLVLDRNFSGVYGDLVGVQNNLTLSGLSVTSYYQSSSGVSNGIVNSIYNASIQQNFFVADELGAPIYWIQNVVYINGSASQGWNMNYTGWIIFPFYGQYPTQTVFEYNYPLTGKIINMPHTFDVKSWITGSGMNAAMNFEVNSQVLQIPVPGAAYIISGSNYTYSWQGHTYYNGPYPDNPSPGGMTPQFGLVGGPSYGIGEFQSPTAGNMNASIMPMGYDHYINASTGTYTYNVDQTGESAANLQWSQASTNSWNLGILNGSTTQGVLSYEPSGYNVSISEKGLPSGSTWYANLSNGFRLALNSNETYFSLPNGTYTINFTGPSGYTPYPSTIVLVVNGSTARMPIRFGLVSNGTLIKPAQTLDMFSGKVYSGLAEVYNSNYYLGGSTAVALDNRSNVLFALNLANNTIVAYDLSNFHLLAAIPYSSTFLFNSLYYNYQSNAVYVGGAYGDVWEINATSMKVANTINIPSMSRGLSTITGGATSGQILFVSNNGNLTILNAFTLAPLQQEHIANFYSLTPSGPFLPSVIAMGDTVYAANYGGNDVLSYNLSSNQFRNYSLPSNYAPLTLTQFGDTENLLVGGMNYSNRLLNTGSDILGPGPNITGLVQGSVLNPYNQYQYFSVAANASFNPIQNIITVNTHTMKIVAEIPSSFLNYNMVFDRANNLIYTSSLFSGTLIAFEPQLFNYTVTFSIGQSLVQSGATWYVNLSNGMKSGPINLGSYTFNLLNGTYTYTVGITSSNYMSHSGSFTVSGSSVSTQVILSKQSYDVIFTETGLPPGTAWSLVFNGSTYTSNSTNYSKIIVYAPNGTYSFSAVNTTHYYSNAWETQNLTINDADQNVTISYTEFSTLTGVISPAGATINVNGKDYSPSANGTYSIDLPAGTYSLMVSDTGYTTSYLNVSLTPGETYAHNFSLNLTATTNPGGPRIPNNLSGNTVYYIIGGAAILVIAGVSFAILRKRR